MNSNALNLLRKEEIKRGEVLGKKLLAKPKSSFMMFFFPFILIPFYYQLKDYQNRFRFFLKEYLFTRNLAFEALEKNLNLEDTKIFLKNKIYKNNENNKLFKLFESQYKESLLHYKFYSQILKKEDGSISKNNILETEIKTLITARELFELKEETLNFSSKLERLLRDEMTAI